MKDEKRKGKTVQEGRFESDERRARMYITKRLP